MQDLVLIDNTWFMPKDKATPTEEYRDDPLAYYMEFHKAQLFEGQIMSFWGHCTCQVSPNADMIAVAKAVIAAEDNCDM
jgi:hypothetical protein